MLALGIVARIIWIWTNLSRSGCDPSLFTVQLYSNQKLLLLLVRLLNFQEHFLQLGQPHPLVQRTANCRSSLFGSERQKRQHFSNSVKESILRKQNHKCAHCNRIHNVVDCDHKIGERSNRFLQFLNGLFEFKHCQAISFNLNLVIHVNAIYSR